MNDFELFKARLADAQVCENVIIVPSGPMYFEERPSRDGMRFTILKESRHTERDINHAKRILRNSRDAVAIQIVSQPH